VLNRNAGWAVALAALRAGPGHHVWNVAEPVSPSEREWAERIGAALGWRGRIVESEASEPPGFDPAQPIILSDARIRAELGYRERHDTAEGLRDNLRRFAEARGQRSS
jgi:nucleoside-diphosphate-sugar epimerase